MRATPKPEQGYTGVNLPAQGPLTAAELMAFFNNLANAGFTFHDDGTDIRPEYLNALPNAMWAKTDGKNKKYFYLYDGLKDNLLWTIDSNGETNNIVFNQSVATKEVLGAIKIGTGLNINSEGLLNLQVANEEDLGGVKIGKNIKVENDGTISVPALGGVGLWDETSIYKAPSLAFGSDNKLYECIKTNGVGTEDGVQNPTAIIYGEPTLAGEIWHSYSGKYARVQIFYVNNYFYGANIDYIWVTSPDGITWLEIPLPPHPDPAKNWGPFVYGNNLFVGFSLVHSAYITSSDGITWTQRTMPIAAQWIAVGYHNGVFIAVARNTSAYFTSVDGIKWTQRALPVSADWRNICYGNGMFLLTFHDYYQSLYYTSPDGIKWTARSFPTTSARMNLFFGNGVFVNNGSNVINEMLISVDGINWTSVSCPPNLQNSFSFLNNQFVAVSRLEPFYYTSPDIINWTEHSIPILPKETGVMHYGGGMYMFVAGGSTLGQRYLLSRGKPKQKLLSDYWRILDTVPVGMIVYDVDTNNKDTKKYLPLIGALLLRADYQDLWAYVNNNDFMVSEQEWPAFKRLFTSGDGLTTFRTPSMIEDNGKCYAYIRY